MTDENKAIEYSTVGFVTRDGRDLEGTADKGTLLIMKELVIEHVEQREDFQRQIDILLAALASKISKVQTVLRDSRGRIEQIVVSEPDPESRTS